MLRYAPIPAILLLLLLAPLAEGGKDETFYPEKVVLDPFPRETPLNGTITFRATLKRGYHAPVFVLTRPDGETSYIHPVRSEPGGVYEFDVGFKDGEGRYRAEVVVESKTGDTTAAQFSIRVGEKAPDETEVEGPRPESLYPDELEAESTIRLERKLFRMLNAYRVENGKKPYPWIEKAAQLGREHMTDYLAMKPRPKRLTHRIPGKDTIADRFMDFFAWPTTIPKFPVRDPEIGPEALCYCAESLAAPRSLDWLFREVFLRESAFRAPVISEFPTHAAVGIVRDTTGVEKTGDRGDKGVRPGRLYTAAIYVQVNSTRVRSELQKEQKETTRLESRSGGDPEKRAELLRRLARMGDPGSLKLFARRLGDRKPEVQAAALDGLFLNDPDRAGEWLEKQLPRLVRAHKDARYADAASVLDVLARVRYDARTRARGIKGLAALERLADTILITALESLDRGEVKEAHETLTLMLEQFAGLEGARKAEEKIREIEADPELSAKLRE